MNETNLQEILTIIGEKEVQIIILRKRIAALEKQLAANRNEGGSEDQLQRKHKEE